MKVLVDTCVWSEVLRHRSPDPQFTKKLKDLIEDGRVVMIGPIRQELLSGISDRSQFEKLKELLSSFEDIMLKTEHFEKGAEFSNICRSKGVQGSIIDFLICSVGYLEGLIIFTSDKDFENYKRHLPIKLLK